jgi:hypothetical protein
MIKFGGNDMNDKYWKFYAELIDSGVPYEEAVIKAHKYMLGLYP